MKEKHVLIAFTDHASLDRGATGAMGELRCFNLPTSEIREETSEVEDWKSPYIKEISM